VFAHTRSGTLVISSLGSCVNRPAPMKNLSTYELLLAPAGRNLAPQMSNVPATIRYGFLGRPNFSHLQSITFSLQGQTKSRHIQCVMVQKHSNRELFEQHLDSHLETFIICCLAVFLMFFGSIYGLLVSKSAAMNLSFLFRSSTLPHAAISCHVNTTFHSRICVIPHAIP
jgi:hypothetical protein